MGNPVSVMSTEEIGALAQDIAAGIALDRNGDKLRAQMGDCAYGAFMAGILQTEGTAIRLSNRLHLDPAQQDRMTKLGGLFVGAEATLLEARQLEIQNGVHHG